MGLVFVQRGLLLEHIQCLSSILMDCSLTPLMLANHMLTLPCILLALYSGFQREKEPGTHFSCTHLIEPCVPSRHVMQRLVGMVRCDVYNV